MSDSLQTDAGVLWALDADQHTLAEGTLALIHAAISLGVPLSGTVMADHNTLMVGDPDELVDIDDAWNMVAQAIEVDGRYVLHNQPDVNFWWIS